MFAKDRFKLGEHAGGAAWHAIKQHLQARLDALRNQNDSPKRDVVKTAFTRGQIAELKYILSLDKPDPLVEPENEFKD